MRTALVTGASGFIGSRLVYQLLLRRWCVHALGRAKRGTSYADRVKAALDDIGGRPIEGCLLLDLRCHEVDICDSGLALSQPISEHLPGADAVLFHVAGDTRFNPTNPETQRQVNISGSLNVVRALQDSVASVVHVSTAYVAGARRGLVLESDVDRGQPFRNCYEKSKLDAEIAVTDLCDRIGLPLTVVRPSIITNDTVTGRSSTFTHLNALVEVINRMQKHYGIGDGEVVSEEIRIPFDPDARPNLAPIDPIVDSLLEVGASTQGAGRTFHLCHPDPQPNSEIVSLVAEAFGVKGKIGLPFVSALPEQPTWTERLMVRALKPYLPYLNESCTFDLTNTKSLIPDYDSRFPAITREYLRKIIEFQRHQGGADKHA
ncbi:MAG: SDR family oxidoreductase [Candidatus Eisenbacteria sp.]|nr:SDR family oxidoreductase [Candidatus Eisenbacteria bacterium]